FNDNSRDWNTFSSDRSKFLVTIGNGSLVLEEKDNRLLPELLPTTGLANFKLLVDVTLSQGSQENGYGVYIRTTSQQESPTLYYRFELYGDGTYAVHKGTPNSSLGYTT